MSDVGWGSDHLEAPKKRRIPLWLLGCGGGCMFVVGALTVAAIVYGPRIQRFFEDLSEPEVQWPRLAEALPFDQPPEGFSIWFLPIVNVWMLESETQDLFVAFLAAPQDKEWGAWLSNPDQTPFLANVDGEWEAREGNLVVQGRELRSVRYTRQDVPQVPREPSPKEIEPSPKEIEPSPKEVEIDPNEEPVREEPAPAKPELPTQLGGGIGIDVTPEGSPRRVLVWILRRSESGTVSDEEAKEFLAPFHVGPRR